MEKGGGEDVLELAYKRAGLGGQDQCLIEGVLTHRDHPGSLGGRVEDIAICLDTLTTISIVNVYSYSYSFEAFGSYSFWWVLQLWWVLQILVGPTAFGGPYSFWWDLQLWWVLQPLVGPTATATASKKFLDLAGGLCRRVLLLRHPQHHHHRQLLQPLHPGQQLRRSFWTWWVARVWRGGRG